MWIVALGAIGVAATLIVGIAINPLPVAAGAILILSLVALSIRFQQYLPQLLILTLPLEATFVVEAGFSVMPVYFAVALLSLMHILRGDAILDYSTSTKLYSIYLAVVGLSLSYAFLISAPDVDTSAAMSARASSLRPLVQFGLLAAGAWFMLLVAKANANIEQALSSVRLYLFVGLLLASLGIWQSFAVTFDLPGQDFTFAFGAASEQGYKYGETRFYSAFISNFAPRATFRESLHFSHYLISIIPLALALVMFRRQLSPAHRRRWYLPLAIAAVTALFLTMSRSGWIAALAGLAYLFVFVPKARFMRMIGASILTVAAVGSILSFIGYFRFDLGLWELIQLRLDAGALESDPRVAYAATLWQTFKEYPVLGVGIGNYGLFGAAAHGLPVVLSAHSIFLNALVETGVIGFLALSAFVAHFFWRTYRVSRQARDLAVYPYLIGIGAGVFAMTLQYLTFGDRPSFYYLFLITIGHVLMNFARENSVARAVHEP